MAEVYWVHLPEHSDVFSQGYVGFTSKTTQERFSDHLKARNSKRDGKSHFYKALRKYGDVLVVDCLCVCDTDYGLELERKLRPVDGIGWNTVVGGGLPPNHLGKKRSQDFISRLKKSLTGRKLSESHILKMKSRKMTDSQRELLSNLLRGRKLSPETRRKMSESAKRVPFYLKNARKGKSSIAHFVADEFHVMYSEGVSVSRTLAASYNVSRQVLRTLWQKFSEGWNPSSDDMWLSFKQEYNHIYLELCAKSDEVADQDNSVANMENS